MLAYKTTSTNPNILILSSATDTFGVTEMMISENSSFTGATWVNFSSSKDYTLSSGYGSKNVYVKFRDAAGNISPTYSKTIEYTQEQVISNEVPIITGPVETVPVSYPDGHTREGLSIFALRFIDANGKPITNLDVRFPQLNLKGTTNDLGYTIFENMPLGVYRILGSYNDKDFSQDVEISKDNAVITIRIENSDDRQTILLLGIFISILLILIVLGIIYFIKKRNKNPLLNQFPANQISY